MGYFYISTMLLPLILFCYVFRNRYGLPTNWPLLGTLPGFLKNLPRLNDFFMELMEKSHLTFSLNGPCFTDINYLFSIDPANVHHVLCKNFGNYVKGNKLNEIFEPLGNGILNADADLWLYQRKVALSFFSHPKFHQFLVDVTLKKLEHGLLPILEHASKHENVIDMQDVFLRFMYDTMCIIVMDHDLKSLSVSLPSFPILKAVSDLEHAAIYRHFLPTFVWKFLRWLNVGNEKKVKDAYIMLDNLIYKCIGRKREERKKKERSEVLNYDEGGADLLSSFIDQDEYNGAPIRYDNEKFLRDTVTNFFLAGAETTSTALTWFFCLLSKNPRVLQKIKEELQQLNSNDKCISVNYNEINNKLIFLHAALCETVRLYPSVVYVSKAPLESDILPSGHHLEKNTVFAFNTYAMGRSKTIWGDDCSDFKPERWLTQDGMIKHEPSYKFSVFGSGPRSCLGKHLAFTLIKIVAVIIIQHYRIDGVERNHTPEVGMVLRMKSGFKAKVLHT